MRRDLGFQRLSSYIVGLLTRRQMLLVLMFAVLHAALLQNITSQAGRILMLMHFALFLLWQPFVSAQSRIASRQIVLMGIVLGALSYWMSWWLMCFWLALLAGLVGGRVFFYNQRSTKVFYLLALSYLISMLMLYAMPYVIPNGYAAEKQIMPLIGYGLPVVIIVMALLPEGGEVESSREAIDLAYSVFIMLMLAVVALGSIAIMMLKQIDYIQALLLTIFTMAATLLLASWLWNPGAGVSGLSAVASRYMLSIGLPFEQWLRSMAELAQQEPDPDRFLDGACKGMVAQLPWVLSCHWTVDGKSSATELPDIGRIKTVFQQGELTLTLATEQAVAPMMVWHFNLVTQLVARFHAEKKRDRQLREMAYMQAVHETGARVTHDVKNLLQSLHALLFVIGEQGEISIDKAQPLLRRQLPLITQRLQRTLDKLRVPETEGGEKMGAQSWWNELRNQYEARGVKFEVQGDFDDKRIAASLFNNAAENLLQNAFDKRAGEPDIDITVLLDLRFDKPVLKVTDTGSPMPSTKAADIGQRPVASENGLGIGLYQLARMAAMEGYGLVLRSNKSGDVCFKLAPARRPD